MTVMTRNERVKRKLSPIGKKHPFVKCEGVACRQRKEIDTNKKRRNTDAKPLQQGRLLLIHLHNVRHQRFIAETSIPKVPIRTLPHK